MPLTATLSYNMQLPPLDNPEQTYISRINWSKCDTTLYRYLTTDLLPPFTEVDNHCIQEYCETLTDVLLLASEKSAPKFRATRKQAWNGDVSRAMAVNKQALHTWRDAGRRTDGTLWDEKRRSKKQLRQALRQTNAESKTRLYQEVVTTCSSDTKLFHRLIKKQRSTVDHTWVTDLW